jgi:DNA polymerase III subunit epsilon
MSDTTHTGRDSHLPVNRLAVLDVETTGLSNRDRIVEVAVVVIDDKGTVVDEYDTLVNPERDVGPTNIHRVTASMVSAAPLFEEIATALASRLKDTILVAHNLAFDTRILTNEYARVGAHLRPGRGICTLRLTGERLDVACKRHGTVIDGHHRALSDARATAELLTCVLEGEPSGIAANVTELSLPLNSRTLRRECTDTRQATQLNRLITSSRFPTSDGPVLSYLDALDWALDDLVITDVEHEQLRQLANDLGLDEESQQRAHQQYLQVIVNAAVRDGIVTAEEHTLMTAVAGALDISSMTIPGLTQLPTAPSSIPLESRVCFTGTAVDASGKCINRSELEEIAALAGLQPVLSVTKTNCDLVIASDPASSSGKAAKARKYGIPVISVGEFLSQSRME